MVLVIAIESVELPRDAEESRLSVGHQVGGAENGGAGGESQLEIMAAGWRGLRGGVGGDGEVEGYSETTARAPRFTEPFTRFGNLGAVDHGQCRPALLPKDISQPQRIADGAEHSSGDSPERPQFREQSDGAWVVLDPARVEPWGVGGGGEGVEPCLGLTADLRRGACRPQIFIRELVERPGGKTAPHGRFGGRPNARAKQD